MAFPCFLQCHYVWTSKYFDQHFLRKNCMVFPNLPLWVELHHRTLFSNFFSAFCLLFCQGSRTLQTFFVLFFSPGALAWHLWLCAFPVIIPQPSRQPHKNRAFCSVLRWRFAPWSTGSLLSYFLETLEVRRVVVSSTIGKVKYICLCPHSLLHPPNPF